MEIEKYIKKLNSLLRVLKDLNKAEVFDEFLEEYKKSLEKNKWKLQVHNYL